MIWFFGCKCEAEFDVRDDMTARVIDCITYSRRTVHHQGYHEKAASAYERRQKELQKASDEEQRKKEEEKKRREENKVAIATEKV